MKLSLILLTTFVAATGAVQAQSNPDYQDFGRFEFLSQPQRSISFITLTELLVFDYPNYQEPVDINNINITFDARDDLIESRPLSD